MKERALVIDDNESSRKIASYLLGKKNVDVIEVPNAADGIHVFLNEELDFVVLDWLMPDLNGQDVLVLGETILNEIKKRQGDRGNKKINVVLYTSTRFESLVLPVLKHFRVLGYISKKWSLEVQRKKFNTIIKELSEQKVA